MTALIQSPAGELQPRSHERTVCEVGNPKLQFWTPPSLPPAHPRPPKKCPADPLQAFMSQLCLGATARSHFNSCTTTLRQAGTLRTSSVPVCLCARVLSVFTRLHACICYCCVVCGVCIFAIYGKALKGKVWMREVGKKKSNGVCTSEREEGKTVGKSIKVKKRKEEDGEKEIWNKNNKKILLQLSLHFRQSSDIFCLTFISQGIK